MRNRIANKHVAELCDMLYMYTILYFFIIMYYYFVSGFKGLIILQSNRYYF